MSFKGQKNIEWILQRQHARLLHQPSFLAWLAEPRPTQPQKTKSTSVSAISALGIRMYQTCEQTALHPMPHHEPPLILLFFIMERILRPFSSGLATFSRVSFSIVPVRPIRFPDLNLPQAFLSRSTLLYLKQILGELPCLRAYLPQTFILRRKSPFEHFNRCLCLIHAIVLSHHACVQSFQKPR
jgi:hypothetical protein